MPCRRAGCCGSNRRFIRRRKRKGPRRINGLGFGGVADALRKIGPGLMDARFRQCKHPAYCTIYCRTARGDSGAPGGASEPPTAQACSTGPWRACRGSSPSAASQRPSPVSSSRGSSQDRTHPVVDRRGDHDRLVNTLRDALFLVMSCCRRAGNVLQSPLSLREAAVAEGA